MSFKEYTIEECCDILNNLRFPLNSEQRFDMQGEFAYYGANGVQGYINQWRFDDDLILIAEDGGNFEQFANRPIAYRVTGKCWVNNHAHVLKAKEKFSQNFVFYSLQHKNILYFIAGGTRSKLTQGELRKIIINHPQKDEADKIASILCKADAAIAQTEALIAKYQRIKTGLMQDLLTKGIDEHGNIRNEQTHRFKTEKGLRVPEDWEVKELAEIGNIVTGSTPPVKDLNNYGEDYLFVTPADVTTNQFIISTDRKLSKLGFSLCRPLPKNSICVVCIGSTIGKISMTNELCTTNQQINTIVPFQIELAEYYFYSLQIFLHEQLRREAGLQAVPIVNKSSFSKILIPLPKATVEAFRILNHLNKIQSAFEKNQNNLHKLQSLKTGLMQDLLSGKVRVKIKEEVSA